MRGIPPHQRQRAQIGAALQQAADELARERDASRDVERHRRCPVRLLIPRQEIPGQCKPEDDQQEQHADHPVQLARLFVRAKHDDAQHVDERGNDDEAGAEEMEAAQHAPEGDALHDEADAVVRVIR
jgi:hypothetical protein